MSLPIYNMIMGFIYIVFIFFPSIVGMVFLARWLGEQETAYLFAIGSSFYLNAKLLDYLSKRYDWYWLETWRK